MSGADDEIGVSQSSAEQNSHSGKRGFGSTLCYPAFLWIASRRFRLRATLFNFAIVADPASVSKFLFNCIGEAAVPVPLNEFRVCFASPCGKRLSGLPRKFAHQTRQRKPPKVSFCIRGHWFQFAISKCRMSEHRTASGVAKCEYH